ncbi:hypothetical protein SLS58_005157 [Diplodia intermedia]|uniref:SnoaL-like domain-containing protein n=1 Tax=Diplodia intermedia TaxID=856260 RepID=A0ABR3TRY5_9PEZI
MQLPASLIFLASWLPQPGPVAAAAANQDVLNNNLSTAAADIEAIKRQLTLYALAIDGRAWAALDAVFAPHATADYGPPLGALAGRDAIRAALPPLLTVWKATQHVLGTVAVDVCGDDGDEAVSVAYMTATHFGRDVGDGEGVAKPVGWGDVVVAYGQYQDRWARDGGDGVWRVVHRNLVYLE